MEWPIKNYLMSYAVYMTARHLERVFASTGKHIWDHVKVEGEKAITLIGRHLPGEYHKPENTFVISSWTIVDPDGQDHENQIESMLQETIIKFLEDSTLITHINDHYKDRPDDKLILKRYYKECIKYIKVLKERTAKKSPYYKTLKSVLSYFRGKKKEEARRKEAVYLKEQESKQDTFEQMRDELHRLKVEVYLDNLIREGTIEESNISRSELSESAYIYLGDIKVRISCHRFNHEKYKADHNYELRLDKCSSEEKEEITKLIERTKSADMEKYKNIITKSMMPCTYEQVEHELRNGKKTVRIKLAA